MIVTASTSNHGIILFCDCEKECCHLVESKAKWIVDSRASFHCILEKEYFKTYKTRNLGCINMGNKRTSQIMGIGNVCVQMEAICIMILKNMRHILDL